MRWTMFAWLLAAVAVAAACDSNSSAASEVDGPDATDQLVRSTTTVVEDVGSKSSDDIRAASATVTAATEGDDAVVDGFCPAHPDGDIVRPTKANAKSPNGWELSGTVKSDSVVLKWSEPEVAGVSGYIVTRHSSALDLSRPHSWTQIVEGSVRAFAVKGRTDEGEWAAQQISSRAPIIGTAFFQSPLTGSGCRPRDWRSGHYPRKFQLGMSRDIGP